MLLKSEKGADLEIINQKAKIKFSIGSNIQLVNERFNIVRKTDSARHIEWMIKGREALQDLLFNVGLRVDNLGSAFRKELRRDKSEIEEHARKILRGEQGKDAPVIHDSLAGRGIRITTKWVRGTWKPRFLAINVVIPVEECKKFKVNYQIELKIKEVIRLGYDVLFWISVAEIVDKKDWTTARSMLGELGF